MLCLKKLRFTVRKNGFTGLRCCFSSTSFKHLQLDADVWLYKGRQMNVAAGDRGNGASGKGEREHKEVQREHQITRLG